MWIQMCTGSSWCYPHFIALLFCFNFNSSVVWQMAKWSPHFLTFPIRDESMPLSLRTCFDQWDAAAWYHVDPEPKPQGVLQFQLLWYFCFRDIVTSTCQKFWYILAANERYAIQFTFIALANSLPTVRHWNETMLDYATALHIKKM